MDFTSMTMADNATSSAVTTSPTPPSGVSVMSEMGGGGRRNSGSGASGSVLFAEEGGDAMFQPHQSHNASITGSHNMAKLRRDSIAHSQGMGGVSWGSLTIGSWLRDEVMLHATLKNSRSNSSSKNTTIHLHPTHRNSSPASPPNGTTASIRRPSHFSAGSPPGAHNAYLPSLEKQYCKDYSCCGLSLPGLHDLLRHYEEAHIATSPGSAIPAGNAAYAASAAHAAASQQKRKSYQGTAPRQAPHTINYSGNRSAVTHQQQHIIQQQPHHRHPGGANGQTMSQQRMPLSPTATSAAHGGLNIAGVNSSLTDPSGAVAGQAPPQLHLNGNLVDAVSTNDVFLQANASQQNTTHNPQMLRRRGDMATMSAVPNASQNGKIPITAQHSFNAYSLNAASKSGQRNTNRLHNSSPHMAMSSANKFSHPMQVGMELDFMDEEDMIGGDIDDPAFMRLTNPLAHGANNVFGAHTNVGAARFNTMNMQAIGHPTPPPSTTAGTIPPHVINDEDDEDDDEDDDDDEEAAIGNSAASKTKSTRHNNHRQEGYIDDPARRLYVMDHEEHKPFKCPVIGCDKTYKNQNGLKYHKVHGHQNQKLHENPDGTFSIIDPESNEPYPDGMGYEKDKPYRCEVCGKRYKNLNGLKYHRGHSTH
ncbi:hypothetical protein HG536_0E01860 [Torulaspora globosa]|uniref:C2H2-type domain-containing protein n=1 Tax=Torulaspora globosa TaxID=48254 RepID=A0A7G3ZID9_9SACH|nr:uncharacterized protein HG536_0E01860 [Torulaspora globosa]QLL33275.1 hypothetical protein HG536_0E01860 [Torulaspora globosa]